MFLSVNTAYATAAAVSAITSKRLCALNWMRRLIIHKVLRMEWPNPSLEKG
jgi:hypothetical protein